MAPFKESATSSVRMGMAYLYLSTIYHLLKRIVVQNQQGARKETRKVTPVQRARMEEDPYHQPVHQSLKNLMLIVPRSSSQVSRSHFMTRKVVNIMELFAGLEEVLQLENLTSQLWEFKL